MQRRVRAVTCSLVGVLLLGCDSSVPPASTTVAVGPHHGTMIRLPEEKGFVELTNEPEVSDRRNPQPTAIVAYYLQADGKTPLSPAPTDVSFAIDTGAERGARGKASSSAPVPLKAEPKPDDPSGSSRFASKEGPYVLAATRGKLSAKIDGQETSITFAAGR